jgi:hypothetical protein
MNTLLRNKIIKGKSPRLYFLKIPYSGNSYIASCLKKQVITLIMYIIPGRFFKSGLSWVILSISKIFLQVVSKSGINHYHVIMIC